MKDAMVFIDAGHGIDTPGKRTPAFSSPSNPALRVLEWEINIAFASTLYKMLKEQFYHVELTSNTVTDLPLSKRVGAVKLEYDQFLEQVGKKAICISFHANAYGKGEEFNYIEGTEFLYSSINTGSKKLATSLSVEFTTRNRGIKERNDLYILKKNPVPTCLVETGFMTCRQDLDRLLNHYYRVDFCGNVMRGIETFFNSHTF